MSYIDNFINKKGIQFEKGFGSRTNQVASKFFETGRDYALFGVDASRKKSFVGPNLLHHSLEYICKGGIVRQYKVETVKQADEMDQVLADTYGHRLLKVWDDFKQFNTDKDLDKFDSLVAKLDAWEEIRYPKLQETQMVITENGEEKAYAVETNFQLQELKRYELDLTEFSRLNNALESILAPFIGIPRRQ